MTKPHKKPNRILHTMLRVRNLDRSLHFYCDILGMQELRRETFSNDRFTLVFLGYQDEAHSSVIELTYNWDEMPLSRGNQFGHIALEVDDFKEIDILLAKSGIAYARAPGLMKSRNDAGGLPDIIAFIEDPDGNQIELIEKPRRTKLPRLAKLAKLARANKTKTKMSDVMRHPLVFL